MRSLACGTGSCHATIRPSLGSLQQLQQCCPQTVGAYADGGATVMVSWSTSARMLRSG